MKILSVEQLRWVMNDNQGTWDSFAYFSMKTCDNQILVENMSLIILNIHLPKFSGPRSSLERLENLNGLHEPSMFIQSINFL